MKVTTKATVYKTRPTAQGTYPIVIRITYAKKSAYINTNLYAHHRQMTKNLDAFTDPALILEIDKIHKPIIDALADVEIRDYWDVNDITKYLKTYAVQTRCVNEEPDLIQFMRDYIDVLKKQNRNSWRNINSCANKLEEYRGIGRFKFSQCTTKFLADFEAYLLEHCGNRAASLYLTQIRTIFNIARKQLNDDDEGIIVIRNYPFANFKIVDRSKSQPRPLSVVEIAQIATYDIIRKEHDHSTSMSRVELARDMFLLSFQLCGINSADIYQLPKPKHGFIEFERTKTRTRRKDRAYIKLAVPQDAVRLLEKYKLDKTYSNFQNFNKAINMGLKIIAQDLNISHLTYYVARYSWATIAHNCCNIPVSVITLALDQSVTNTVTARYIQQDFRLVDEANAKVNSYLKTATRWLVVFRRLNLLLNEYRQVD